MKTIRLGSCVLLVALSTVAVYAQTVTNLQEITRSPVMQRIERGGLKQAIRSYWTGDSTNPIAIAVLQIDDFRKGISVSQEQNQKIQDVMQNLIMSRRTDPDLMPMIEEMD